jgi:hypothetical protein
MRCRKVRRDNRQQLRDQGHRLARSTGSWRQSVAAAWPPYLRFIDNARAHTHTHTHIYYKHHHDLSTAKRYVVDILDSALARPTNSATGTPGPPDLADLPAACFCFSVHCYWLLATGPGAGGTGTATAGRGGGYHVSSPIPDRPPSPWKWKTGACPRQRQRQCPLGVGGGGSRLRRMVAP